MAKLHPTCPESGLCSVAGHSHSIPLYVKRTQNDNGAGATDERRLPELWAEWEQEGREFWLEMDGLVEMLDGLDVLDVL